MDEGFIITFLLKWSGIKDKVMRLMNIRKKSDQSSSKKEVIMTVLIRWVRAHHTKSRVYHAAFIKLLKTKGCG